MSMVAMAHWSTMSFSAAIVAWEALKNRQDSGNARVSKAKSVKFAAKGISRNKRLLFAESIGYPKPGSE